MEYAVMDEQDVPAIAKVYMEYITFTRTAAGSTKKRTNGSIREIVIFAAYQNKGYGTALLQEIERRARERGAEHIELVSVNDAHHMRFFSSFGMYAVSNLNVMGKHFSA